MDNIADKKYSSFLPNNFQYEFEQEKAAFGETFGAQFGYYYDGTVKKVEEMIFTWHWWYNKLCSRKLCSTIVIKCSTI